ncbi:MAG: glycine--tRNA ligase [Candidatus Omnitrophota bacterium]|jgi:glycyl-tRNA synthetase|nr:MAG: glycine--tRNA ligase [Candidatus Omnitrophota bacterium]
MAHTNNVQPTLNDIVALCKRRGFIFPSSEIYGGFAASWDYGPLGVELKNNVKQLWWRDVVTNSDNVVGMDGAITTHPRVWEASGHVEGFHDPMVDCKTCGHRFRADKLDEETCPNKPSKKVSECGGELTDVRNFNLMFKLHWGPVEDSANITYLRPETCQTIFPNFKNILTVSRMRVPFGIAQVGKSFRNEITTKSFIFRQREFEQMELEFFSHPDEAKKWFEYWLERRKKWYIGIGVREENLRMRQHDADELAHYADDCYDVEYKFPMGWSELEGIANRTNYDLTRHMEFSKKDLSYRDDITGEKYIPYVIESSAGVDRTILVLLSDAYDIDQAPNDKGEMEERLVLRFSPQVAPVSVAVFPLFKKPNLVEIARKIESDLRGPYRTMYDETGNIGKRYRRQDEIGTPLCITVDYDSLDDHAVTIRNRDSMEQVRVGIDQIHQAVADQMKSMCSSI